MLTEENDTSLTSFFSILFENASIASRVRGGIRYALQFFWKFTSFWELGSGLNLIRHTYMYEFQDIFINVHIVRKFNLREDIYIVYTVYFV